MRQRNGLVDEILQRRVLGQGREPISSAPLLHRHSTISHSTGCGWSDYNHARLGADARGKARGEWRVRTFAPGQGARCLLQAPRQLLDRDGLMFKITIETKTAAAMAAPVKVFGCRPFTDACRRAETGPAFENLQGRKPRVGRAPIRRRELWGFECRRRLLASGRNEHQRRFGRIERSQGVFSAGHGMIFLAAAMLGRGGRRIFGRAPAARSNDQRQKRAELRRCG